MNNKKNLTSFLVIFLIVFILFFFLNKPSSNKNTLRIYTYSSFLSHYGPGPVLKDMFEKTCNCEVEFVDAGDAGLIIQRLSLNPKDHVDMVIGLDYLTLNKAQQNHQWLNYKVNDVEFSKDFLRTTDSFTPYDWSPMTFIYRDSEVENLPKSLSDMTGPEFHKKFLFQDPRSSTPGQQFLFWSLSEYGLEQGFKLTGKLLRNIKKLSPSWSAAYGYFQQKKASYVFSYLTSLIYHWKVEKNFDYKAVVFEHNHPVQIEYFGIPKKCTNCDLAKNFANFLMTISAQEIIAEKNYMYPVIKQVVLDEDYKNLPELKTYSLDSYTLFQDNFSEHLKRWESLIRN